LTRNDEKRVPLRKGKQGRGFNQEEKRGKKENKMENVKKGKT
jgi:hypothetical protein